MNLSTTGCSDEQATVVAARGQSSLAVAHRSTVWSYRSLMITFARRELHGKFKGTALGVLWSLALPLATLATYSLVFGVFFPSKPPPLADGRIPPFFLFLFSGLVPWNFFFSSVLTAIASLLGNGGLMKKIYFPPYASIFGSNLAVAYQSAIELSILVGVLIAFGNIGVTYLLLIPWVILFFVFCSSASIIFSILNIYMRDITYIVTITMQLIFYMTPIIYPISQVPIEKLGIPLRMIIKLMPLSAFVEVFRSISYRLEAGSYKQWLICLGWTTIAAIGARLVYVRRGLDLSEEL